MAPATEAQRAQMAVDVEDLRRQFLRGLARQGLSLAATQLVTPLFALFDMGTGTTRRNLEGMEQVRKDMGTWSTRWKEWALAGQREDGSAYSVERWQEVGRSIARDITFWTGETIGRSAFVLVGQQYTDAATTLGEWKEALEASLPELPEPPDLRLLKLAAGAAAAVLLMGTAGYLIRSVKR